jgi:peptidoglycan/xylan/chitin deacetylase (PgdA/CDA1 family)
MTRFHIALLATLLLVAAAGVMGSAMMFVAVIVAFLVVGGLGVAIPQMRFFGPFVCRGVGDRRRVALTFDDGPDAQSTPALLDLLRRENVAAAFFCIGKRVVAHPELAARIVREGHLLENHSYHHSNGTNFLSTGRLNEELAQAQKAAQSASGIAPRLYRPPVGLSNPRTFRVAHALGMKVVGWTAGGLDTVLKEPERVVARVLKRLRPGAIVLLHDGNIPAERAVATVTLLLDSLRKLDYQVVRLDELLNEN